MSGTSAARMARIAVVIKGISHGFEAVHGFNGMRATGEELPQKSTKPGSRFLTKGNEGNEEREGLTAEYSEYAEGDFATESWRE